MVDGLSDLSISSDFSMCPGLLPLPVPAFLCLRGFILRGEGGSAGELKIRNRGSFQPLQAYAPVAPRWEQDKEHPLY